MLPPQVSLSQFMQAYEKEITRLEQYEQTIVDNISHYDERYEEAKEKLAEF